MNDTKVLSAVNQSYSRNKTVDWEIESERLHRNFCVIDTILSKSAGLPYETVKQYAVLQHTILDTMDELLIELEQAERGGKINQSDRFNHFLVQHALVMKHLNNRVSSLIEEVTA